MVRQMVFESGDLCKQARVFILQTFQRKYSHAGAHPFARGLNECCP